MILFFGIISPIPVILGVVNLILQRDNKPSVILRVSITAMPFLILSNFILVREFSVLAGLIGMMTFWFISFILYYFKFKVLKLNLIHLGIIVIHILFSLIYCLNFLYNDTLFY